MTDPDDAPTGGHETRPCSQKWVSCIEALAEVVVDFGLVVFIERRKWTRSA
jgi:hypothetical protein